MTESSAAQKVLAEQVIVRGDYLYPGHKDAWRLGTVMSPPEERGPGTLLVTVQHPPQGRERTTKTKVWPVHWLLKDTPEVRAKLATIGVQL